MHGARIARLSGLAIFMQGTNQIYGFMAADNS
jgi:hypothetical protein